MSDQWPPPATDVGEAFRKAHDHVKAEPVQTDKSGIVTKKDIDDLEKQRKLPTAQQNLTPRGVRTSIRPDHEKAARLEKMRQRLREGSAKAREDFDRSAGLGL